MAFTSQITGSPFTTPNNNIGGLAYTNVSSTKRIYYTTDSDFTKIFCMSLTGAADTGREITLNSQGEAGVYPGRGLCSDGTYLYALVGTLGSQYMHVYQLSDRSYVGTHELGFDADHYARGIETFIKPGTTNERRINFLQDNIIRSYTITISGSTITMSQQTDGSFTLPINEMVNSGSWQSIAWDSTVNRLLVAAEQTTGVTERDKIFGFTYNGSRDDREDFLPGVDIDAMTYNSDDADLYMVHETSTNLYAWGDFPRFQLGSLDLNITEGVTYTANIAALVDAGATLSIQTDITSGFYTGLSLSTGTLTWTNPPAPQGGASRQTVSITIRATTGANSTDQIFNFVLHAANQDIIQPVWAHNAFPRQTVYEPYTPPQGAPDPHLTHGFSINLSDYVAAGTPPYTFSVATDGTDFPGTASITTRYVNQQPVQDRLVFNASNVAASQLNRFLNVTVSNSAGTSTQRLPLEVVNLIYPSWHGSREINLSLNASYSQNLRDFSTGEPQADIDFVGSPPSEINAHLVNGQLTLRSITAGTYSIVVKLTNILTTTDGVQQTFTVTAAAAQQPTSAPIWFPDPIEIETNRGTQARIDLNQYIQSGNPSPSFGVSAGEGILGTIEGEIFGQHFLQYTIPDSITENTNYSVDVTATNSVDAAVKTINIVGIANTVPRWLPINAQRVAVGGLLRVDFQQYILGIRPITFTFDPTYDILPNMEITGSLFTYAPIDLTEGAVIYPQIDASNELGTTTTTFPIQLIVQAAPVWTEENILLELVEGGSETIPLLPYITSGSPTPQFRLGDNYDPTIFNIAIAGTSLIIRAPQIDIDTTFTIPVVSYNIAGAESKNILVDVLARTTLDDLSILSLKDYDEIRSLIDVRLTSERLPDNVIAQDVYQGQALDWVLGKLPVNPTRSAQNLKRKKRAFFYRCAGLIAGRVPLLTGESVQSLSRQYDNVAWLDLQTLLFEQADYEVDQVLLAEQGETVLPPLIAMT